MADEGAGFGVLLRAHRRAAGLSQEDLVRRSGLDVRTIRDLERGRTRWPYPDTVRRLADALDLPGPDRDEFTAAAGRRLALSADEADSDTAPTFGAGSLPSGGHRPVIPRELPGAVRTFTGRAGEMAALSGLLEHADQAGPGTVVISAIGGTAGVGKTALALQWAHQVAGRFPDGQLYVNLRGYDPGPPMPATDALAGFLRSMGVPGQDIPPEADQRAARYRSLLAGRRMLILLDNAGSADQVRPLLPGAPSCTVLVTSRGTLAGLVARDGATRLDLDVLPPEDAVALLRTLIGARVDAEPAAAAELVSQCCRLPLALRVVAELAASHPAMPLATLTGELTDLRTRLDLLAAGEDPSTQVRAVFSWSYRHLDPDAAQTFRLLGLHPGPDFEPYEVAALIAATLQQARQAVDVLARAHLIEPVSPNRYGMHDLLRSYARELAATVDGDQEQHAALTRLFDHYLHTAATAMDTLHPVDRHHRPRIPRPAIPVPQLPGPVAARQWLDGRRAVLTAAVAHAADHDWPGHATKLAATLARYLDTGSHCAEALTISSRALGAARRTGDRAAEATALNLIGDVHWQHGRYQQAGDHYRRALALFRGAGDRVGEARALRNIGLAEMELGRCEQAARYEQEALAVCRDIVDHVGEASALGNLGLARRMQGRDQEAAGYCQQSLGLFRQIGDLQGEAFALGRLGVINGRLGRWQQAAEYLEQALALFDGMNDKATVSEVRVKLGDVYVALGHHEQAARNFEQALAISRERGDPAHEADALSSLGDVLLRRGELDQAYAHYFTALQLASEIGSLRRQTRAQAGLARTHQADAGSVQTQYPRQEALTRDPGIGTPEASDE